MVAAFKASMESLHPGPMGRRFCIWHEPTDRPPVALFVHVHAFAEEMNKSRRMVAMQSRALAADGHAVLCIDLLGCGDSAGDFGDATWDIWVDDVIVACELAQNRVKHQWPDAAAPTLWLWGLRAGCLLAAAAADRLASAWHLLFWQPTLSGRAVLQQFLRLESAGAMLGKARAADAPSAKQLLEAGAPAQVGGYMLHPALAAGLQAARLGAPKVPRSMHWIEVAQVAADPSPATQSVIDAWTAAACAVHYRSVEGPSFWHTTELEDAPALVGATIDAVRAALRAAPGRTASSAPAVAFAQTADL
jgi:exosortase A-associated hydrolase 2